MYATPRSPARGPSYPVHVRLQVRRRIVRYHGTDAVDIQPARRGVRRDQHPRVAGGERAQRLGARGLRRERAVLGEDRRGATASGFAFRLSRPSSSPRRPLDESSRNSLCVASTDASETITGVSVFRSSARSASGFASPKRRAPPSRPAPRAGGTRALGRRRLGVRRGGEHARRVKEQPGESRGVPRERRGDEDLLNLRREAPSSPTAGRPPRAGGGHHLRRPVLVRLPQDAVRLGDDQVLNPGQGGVRRGFAQVRDEATRGCHQHVELIVRVELIGPVVEGGLEAGLRGGVVSASPPGRVIDPDFQADRPAEGLEHPRHLERQVAGGHDDERKPRRGLLTRYPGPGEARTPESCRCPSARTRTSLGRTSSRRRCVATPQIARRTSWTHPERAGWPSIFHPSPAPHRVRPDAPTGTTSAVASIVKPVASSARIGMCGFF